MGNGITVNKKQLPGGGQPPGARKIVVIPYQKWIYCDARRFGHFNQFSTEPTSDLISNSNNLSNNSISSVLPSLSSSSFSTPTSFVSTSLSLTNDFIIQTKSQLASASVPSSMAYATSKFSGRNNNPSASALVGSAMTLSSSSSIVNYSSTLSSNDLDSRRLIPKPIYYVNGRFFKSLTRLGDAQFILSEHGEEDVILTIPSNIERYRTNDNAVRDRIHRLNRVIACCDEFLVFQLWKGNNEVEIFLFERPVPSKCTCSQRQTQRPNSSPPIQQDLTPPSTRTTITTPNKHSSLMQTATLSAYHPSEPQRSPIKSCSLLNENENRLDMSNETYDFVDTTKKASFLTGSARCTLVTAAAATHNAQSPNTNSTNTSRSRFGGKLPSRSATVNTRSYSISNTNELINPKHPPSSQGNYLNRGSKHRSTPYLSSLSSASCTCTDNNDLLAPSTSSSLSSSSTPPTFSLCSPSLPTSSTWNSRIVRKLNSIAHRFNARSYTCLISPDRTKLLITPDYEDKHSYSHQTHEVTVIFDIKTYAILRLTPARYDQRFAFDPRYGHSRLAEFDTVRGQITDIKKDRVLVCSNHTLKTKVYRVEYTKDGHLIIVLCTLPIFQRVKRNYFLYILNSSTLLHTRSIIDYRGPFFSPFVFTNEFSLLFNIYPSLSHCGSTLAVLKNIEPSSNIRLIEVYSLPYTCATLKEVTRRNILRYVDRKQLRQLPLPENLKAYLAYKPQYV